MEVDDRSSSSVAPEPFRRRRGSRTRDAGGAAGAGEKAAEEARRARSRDARERGSDDASRRSTNSFVTSSEEYVR
eukprot:30721-Pelagococcus_subviridis.AAC.7